MLNAKYDLKGYGNTNDKCKKTFMIMLIVSFDNWISQYPSGVSQD